MAQLLRQLWSRYKRTPEFMPLEKLTVDVELFNIRIGQVVFPLAVARESVVMLGYAYRSRPHRNLIQSHKIAAMPRSSKKQKHTPTQQRTKLSATGNCEDQAEMAAAALLSGRHKDAIVIYKDLLKGERRGVWLAGLGSAYAARARELADKGMFKEALVIWEQRAVSCETTLMTTNYIVWTLQAGKLDAALKLFTDPQCAADSTIDRALISEYFAALALTGETRILELLPAEDAVVRDHASANALLKAFCNGEETALETHLKAIPYRSPYRDFRQIVKAWQLGEHAFSDLLATVNRVGTHSPFRGLGNILLELYSPECEPITTAQQEGSTLLLKAAISGWSRKQVELFKAAELLGPVPNAKALFNLLLRFTAVFEEAVARNAALKLLIHYPQGKIAFTKHFGKLSPLELARLEAQMADIKGDPYQSDSAWRDVLDELEKQREPGVDQQREAVILRKLADQWLRFEREIFPQPGVVADLTESLALDPDDIATHVKVIELQRKSDNLKGARASVKAALERFPYSIPVLMEAVQTAIAGNAFKKAASIAQQILKLDPINIKVQGILVDAHLAHSRKQIKAQKFDLARRELSDAASWARSAAIEGRVKLVIGLLEYSAKETDYGLNLLKEGVELCGGKLVGQYQLLVEAHKLGLQRQNWLKLAALPKASNYATRDPVIELVKAVGNTHGLENDDIYGTLLQFESVLRKSLKEPYTRQEMELICDTLHRFGMMRLLEKFARQARLQWPDESVFVFQALYAKADGALFKLNQRDFDQLDDAFHQARQDGDSRTAHRIMEFIEPPNPFGFFPELPPGFPSGPSSGFPPELPQGFPADLAAIINEIGPDAMEALLEAMERDLGDQGDNRPQSKPRKAVGVPKPKKRVANRDDINPDQKELF